MNISQTSIEEHRKLWADVAKKNGWYKEPFFIQVWVGLDGDIADSVSFHGMTQDVVIQEVDGDYAHCISCGQIINLDTDEWTTDDSDTFCAIM